MGKRARPPFGARSMGAAKVGSSPQVRAPAGRGTLVGSKVSGWRCGTRQIGALAGASPFASAGSIARVATSPAAETGGVGRGARPATPSNPPAVRGTPDIGPPIPAAAAAAGRERATPHRYRVTSGPFPSPAGVVKPAVAVKVA